MNDDEACDATRGAVEAPAGGASVPWRLTSTMDKTFFRLPTPTAPGHLYGATQPKSQSVRGNAGIQSKGGSSGKHAASDRNG